MTSPALTIASLLRYRRLSVTLDIPVRVARQLFRRYRRLRHLPIVSAEGRYLALLPLQALQNAPPDAPIETLTRVPLPPLPPYATIYDAIQQLERHQLSELPVASDEGIYLGLLTTDALVHWWSQLGAVQEPGAVLILETTPQDYSLTDIASILESDNIRILSAYLLTHSDPRRIYVVLKVNSIYLSRSIDLLERKGYGIVAVHGDIMMERQAREQLSALLRYLNM